MESSKEKFYNVSLAGLSVRCKWKLNRCIPWHVSYATLRTKQPSPNAERLLADLNRFMEQETGPSLPMLTLTLALCDPVLLEQDYSLNLIKDISQLLRDYSHLISIEFWVMLESQIDMGFFVAAKHKIEIKNELKKWSEILEEGEGKIPFLSISNTVKLLEKYLATLSNTHELVTNLNMYDFLEWSKTQGQMKNVYIPFWESVYALAVRRWKFRGIKRENVFVETGHVKTVNTFNTFSFPVCAKPFLRIGDQNFSFKGAKRRQLDLLKYLLWEERDPYEKHSYAEITGARGETTEQVFYDAARNLNAKITRESSKGGSCIDNFIIYDKEECCINNEYKQVSES